MQKRDEPTMMDLIMGFAKNDERIRALILNGSRACPNTPTDEFSDYDLIALVEDVEPFVANRAWIKTFGEPIIMQTPDIMDEAWPKDKDKFTFLILLTDTNRIDITFMTLSRYQATPRDSQSVLLLDKEQVLEPFAAASDKDYFPKPPTQKDYDDCCNEFYWVSTYVAKGLARNQVLYAKQTAEHIVKEQLIRMMSWQAGINTGFKKSLGVYHKNLEAFMDKDSWDVFKATYVGCDIHQMWQALFIMCELFQKCALTVAKHFGFTYPQKTAEDVIDYLIKLQLSKSP